MKPGLIRFLINHSMCNGDFAVAAKASGFDSIGLAEPCPQEAAAGRGVDGLDVAVRFRPPDADALKRSADGEISRVSFPHGSRPDGEVLETLDGCGKWVRIACA